jgi:hypothetical protein
MQLSGAAGLESSFEEAAIHFVRGSEFASLLVIINHQVF